MHPAEEVAARKWEGMEPGTRPRARCKQRRERCWKCAQTEPRVAQSLFLPHSALILAFTTHGTITKGTNPHFPSWTRPSLQEPAKDYLQQVARAYTKLSIEHTSACLSICLAAPPSSILAQATQNRSQHRDKNKINTCLPTGWHSAPPQNTTFSHPA